MISENELLSLLMKLLARTTPHGREKTLARYLPRGGTWDAADNYIVEVGTGSETLFASHLDTVGSKSVKVNPVIEHGIIHAGRRKVPCLGGDDKCGVLCLIAMIAAGVPGVYIFHAGEECGGIGSDHIAKTMDLTRFKRAVEFDRRGKFSVITSMGWTDTCSLEFAEALCDQLGRGFFPDPTGSFTDVLQYADVIPEVSNVSSGYENAHSAQEIIDADWLITELIPKLYKVDWEALPVKRDPTKTYNWETGLYGGYSTRSFPWWDDTDDGIQLCDLCAYPIMADMIHVVELDDYSYHVCPDCAEYFESVRV